MTGKYSGLKIIGFLCLLSATALPVRADLQWITGSVPKNTVDRGSSNAIVKDAPVPSGPVSTNPSQNIIVCHMITCTKIVNNYPNDSVNYFYINKNKQVCFYLYFLIKPASRIHTATIECYNPSGTRIAKYDQEFRVNFTDRLLTVDNDTYQWFLTSMTLGMDHLRPEFGQTDLPADPGLYTFRTTVDGQLIGITFFYVKDQPIQSPAPIATMPPTSSTGMSGVFPMSTPTSSQPIAPSIP